MPSLTRNRRVAAVVLAAGLSQRFGGDKLIHPYRGKPLAAHIADTLSLMELATRLAICSRDNPARTQLFSSRGFEIIINPAPVDGLASSLAVAAKRADELPIDALLVCLADMPHISSTHLLALVKASERAEIVVTQSNGIRLPPAIFARTMFGPLTELSGDEGARSLMKNSAALQVEPEQTRDFDTRSDFE